MLIYVDWCWQQTENSGSFHKRGWLHQRPKDSISHPKHLLFSSGQHFSSSQIEIIYDHLFVLNPHHIFSPWALRFNLGFWFKTNSVFFLQPIKQHSTNHVIILQYRDVRCNASIQKGCSFFPRLHLFFLVCVVWKITIKPWKVETVQCTMHCVDVKET